MKRIEQGDIYLVNFGRKYNSEIGKIRPAVIVQHDMLNRTLPHVRYKGVLVVPLTTDDVITEYKITVSKRENLHKDSFIIANWICTIDYTHILFEKGRLTKLRAQEIEELKKRICALM
ncbi:MAG TPA: type II toxin-antitoxin system PemK/MazF family toxin [Campylobacteraceae bacterium]|jgi:mRNA interferase MazF|nr:type II toxin-antitoxin system PemK/MazF family toxin [Campylobacteraceae bacterium]